MSSTVFNVQNTHLQKIQPDILGFGITTFVDQIQFAENDVLRRIREEWWEDTDTKLDTKILQKSHLLKWKTANLLHHSGSYLLFI